MPGDFCNAASNKSKCQENVRLWEDPSYVSVSAAVRKQQVHSLLTAEATVFTSAQGLQFISKSNKWRFPFISIYFFVFFYLSVSSDGPEPCLAGLQIFQGSNGRGQGVRAAPQTQLEILSALLLLALCHRLRFSAVPRPVSHSHFSALLFYVFFFSLAFSVAPRVLRDQCVVVPANTNSFVFTHWQNVTGTEWGFTVRTVWHKHDSFCKRTIRRYDRLLAVFLKVRI